MLPLKNWSELAGKPVFYLRAWVAHPTYDDYWRARGIDDRLDQVTVPALNIGGWYDIFSKATLDHIAQVRCRSTNHAARRNQFVVLGPWGHGVGVQKLGDLDFGPSAKLDLGNLQFDWFEYWLKGKNTGVQDWPAVRLFVMGENVWRDEHEWPLRKSPPGRPKCLNVEAFNAATFPRGHTHNAREPAVVRCVRRRRDRPPLPCIVSCQVR